MIANIATECAKQTKRDWVKIILTATFCLLVIGGVAYSCALHMVYALDYKNTQCLVNTQNLRHK